MGGRAGRRPTQDRAMEALGSIGRWPGWREPIMSTSAQAFSEGGWMRARRVAFNRLVVAAAPDLTIRILRGQAGNEGRLLWSFESPPLGVKAADPIVTDLGSQPEAFARRDLALFPYRHGSPRSLERLDNRTAYAHSTAATYDVRASESHLGREELVWEPNSDRMPERAWCRGRVRSGQNSPP